MGMNLKKVKTYFSKGILITAQDIRLQTVQKAQKKVPAKNISHLEQNKKLSYDFEAQKNRIRATYYRLPPY